MEVAFRQFYIPNSKRETNATPNQNDRDGMKLIIMTEEFAAECSDDTTHKHSGNWGTVLAGLMPLPADPGP